MLTSKFFRLFCRVPPGSVIILLLLFTLSSAVTQYQNCYTAIDSFRYYRNHPELWEDSYLKREALGLPHPEPKQSQALIFTAGTTWVEGHLDTSVVWDTTDSPYIITGDFYIDYPCTLWIRPGVDVLYHRPGGLYSIIVDGYLLAIGDSTDSIIFSYDTLIDLTQPQWESIIFQNDIDSISTIKFCRIIYGRWCIVSDNSSPNVTNTLFDLKYEYSVGHPSRVGLYCWNNSRTYIYGNCFTTGYIFADFGVVLEDSANAIVRNNSFHEISSAIQLSNATSATIDSNNFNNVAIGLAIYNSSPDCEILIRRNVFERISSLAIDVHGSNSIVNIFNNIFYNNEESGIGVCYGGRAEIVNNILFKNGTDSLIYRGAIAICLDVPYIVVKHNLFHDNFNDFGGGDYYIPPGVKEIITTNINGDSCDTFFNLFGYNPSMDTITFCLNEDSPCINAGDSNLTWDPDGTIPDIGAYYYDTTTFIFEVLEPIIKPSKPIKVYPNPFNNFINISFYNSENRSKIKSFKIFNILGEEIIDLTSMLYFNNIIIWKPEVQESGIFLIRYKVDRMIYFDKIIFLK